MQVVQQSCSGSHEEWWTQRAVEGLTACTKHDVTANGHTDVTTGLTTGLTHTHAQDSECYSALVTIVMSWEGQRVGPPWVDEWEDMYTCILLGETEEMRTNNDRRHNTCIFNKVLLRCEVKLP